MSSSEKRTIKINPELFKVSEKNTSRKKQKTSNVNIKVKSPSPKRDKTFRKGVLRMIRENIQKKQKEEYKQLIEGKPNITKDNKNTSSAQFESDFGKSIQYFNSLNESVAANNKANPPQRPHNYTLRNNSSVPIHNMGIESTPIESSLIYDATPIYDDPSPTYATTYAPPFVTAPHPGYGNLKNGTLPTYRKMMGSTTRRNQDYSSITNTSPIKIDSTEITEKQTVLSEMKKDLIEKRTKSNLHKKKNVLSKDGPKLRYLKRRKIYKRTYRIGRSTIFPKIGVLISNKTIRQRISTDALNLKQASIPEIKKFLIKKGFIKVGSIAPNDILRQMYETANLMCGEIENHNSETLLYNYFNDRE